MKTFIPEDLRGKTLSNIIVVAFGILLTAAVVYFGRIWGFITTLVSAAMPFIIGFAIAFLLLPIVNRVEWFFNHTLFRKKAHPRLNRVLASLIAFIVLLTLVAGFFAILVPRLFESVKSILQYIANFISMHSKDINDLLLKLEFLNIEGEQLVIAWENVVSEAMSYTSFLFNNVMAIAGGIGSGVYAIVFHFVVGLIAAFYLLLDKEVFSAQCKKICYAVFKRPTCERLIYWTRRANTIFAGFITGKILDSLIIGLICYVFMLIFRIEYPLLISVIVGLTNVIPFFGPFIGGLPSALLLLIVNPLSALWFVIFIVILQQLDGNLIGPFILGDYVGLSPFWIMMSIMIGGGLFGFVGMLISVPMFALIYAVVRTVIDSRLQKRDLPTQSAFYTESPENLREDTKHETPDI